MKTALNRLKEPSTWAGIGVVIQGFATQGATPATVGAALAALLAIFMPEQNHA